MMQPSPSSPRARRHQHNDEQRPRSPSHNRPSSPSGRGHHRRDEEYVDQPASQHSVSNPSSIAMTSSAPRDSIPHRVSIASSPSPSPPIAASPSKSSLSKCLRISFVIVLLVLLTAALSAMWIASIDRAESANGATSVVVTKSASSSTAAIGEKGSDDEKVKEAHPFVTQPYVTKTSFAETILMPIDDADRPSSSTAFITNAPVDQVESSTLSSSSTPLPSSSSLPLSADPTPIHYVSSSPSIDPHSTLHLYSMHNLAKRANLKRHDDELDLAGSKARTHSPHLFLRSTPSAREAAITSAPIESDDKEQLVTVVMHPTPVANDASSFGTTSSSSSAELNAPIASSSVLARPYIVHVRVPITDILRARLSSALSSSSGGGGYHVAKYVQVGNFILVPNDATSSETLMMRALDAMKPATISWHLYETRDKIEPMLFDNCAHPHTLLASHNAANSTFDLTISLFHAAVTGSHLHSSSTDHAARAHRVKMHSIHSHIPRRTRGIADTWTASIASHGESWNGVDIEAEAAHFVSAKIPVRFMNNMIVNNNANATASTQSTNATTSFCALLRMFASHPHTEYIEAASDFSTHNRYAAPLVQSGSYTRPSLFHSRGLTGRNQIITVADTGVAHGMCFFSDPNVPTPVDTVNFAHRKIVSYVNTRGKDYDMPAGHGSHTAASIAGHIMPSTIAGAESSDDASTLARLAEYNGVAFEAKLAIFDVNDGLTSGKIKPPKDIYAQYYQLAYETMGARISSNSWGSRNGSYIVECRETDRFVHDHPDFLPIFSSGNYGEKGYQSVVSPGTSKNCLTIGAVGNVKISPQAQGSFFCAKRVGISNEPASSPGYRTSPSDYMSSFSSTDVDPLVDESIALDRMYSYISGSGPTYDGRFKPEVMAPGHYIISAKSGGSVDKDTCKSCDSSLMSLFGTSMSAAIAAGSAAIARQYFMDGWYPSGSAVVKDAFTPSAALLKATLIASAVPDTVESGAEYSLEELDPSLPHPIPRQTGPTPKSGFGRIQLDTVLKLQPSVDATTGEMSGRGTAVGSNLWVIDQRKVSTLEFHAYCFRIKQVPIASSSSSSSSTTNDGSMTMSPLLPFRTTLVWSDPPASMSASWLLVNNLDLSVTHTANGNTNVGNQHSNDPNPTYDSVNNSEQVTIPTHQLTSGEFISVHVRGTHVPEGPQKYALVVNGAMEAVDVAKCSSSPSPSPSSSPSASSSSPSSLSTTSSIICPARCNARGTCTSSGACDCAIGYAGTACEMQSKMMPTCVVAGGDVKYGKWVYYHFDVDASNNTMSSSIAGQPSPPPTLTSIRVLMHSVVGSPDLYLSLGRLPSLQDHDYAHLLTSRADAAAAAALLASSDASVDPSSSASSALLASEINIPIAQSGRYYIGVYGYCCDDNSKFMLHVQKCKRTANDIMQQSRSMMMNGGGVQQAIAEAKQCTCSE